MISGVSILKGIKTSHLMSTTRHTGIDLSKILGGQTKILGEKVVKSDKCMGDSQLLGGTCPGCSPKSTPMTQQETRFR